MRICDQVWKADVLKRGQKLMFSIMRVTRRMAQRSA